MTNNGLDKLEIRFEIFLDYKNSNRFFLIFLLQSTSSNLKLLNRSIFNSNF